MVMFIFVVGVNIFIFSMFVNWNGIFNLIISICWSNNNIFNIVIDVLIYSLGFIVVNVCYVDSCIVVEVCGYIGSIILFGWNGLVMNIIICLIF